MSIDRSGFHSRCCFCLWSHGNPELAIRDNHKTVLHTLWERDHFYVTIENEEGKETHFSFCRALWSFASYPFGMAGYFVDTMIKVVLLVGNSLVFFIALLSCNKKWMRERGILVLDTAAAVGIGLIGIFIPPLAYKLDKWTQEGMVRWLISFSRHDFMTPQPAKSENRPPKHNQGARRRLEFKD